MFVLAKACAASAHVWSAVTNIMTHLTGLTSWLQGAKKEMQDTWPCNPKGGPGMFDLYYEDCSDLNQAACWIAAAVGVGLSIIVSCFGIPLLKRQYDRNQAKCVCTCGC